MKSHCFTFFCSNRVINTWLISTLYMLSASRKVPTTWYQLTCPNKIKDSRFTTVEQLSLLLLELVYAYQLNFVLTGSNNFNFDQMMFLFKSMKKVIQHQFASPCKRPADKQFVQVNVISLFS